MAGLTRVNLKTFTAEAQILPRRIVKFGAGDTLVTPGTASTDLIFGVSTEVQAEIGEPCDVQMSDIAEVVYGGAVTRGQKLTSDGSGRAVAAAPGAGVNAQILGIAMASGVLNDVGTVLLKPSVMQG